MKISFIYWKEGDYWLGFLENYPDYQSQGKTLEELQNNLKDIYSDLNSGEIPQS